MRLKLLIFIPQGGGVERDVPPQLGLRLLHFRFLPGAGG